MLLLTSSIFFSLAPWVAADIHHLFASAFRSPHLFSLEYDTVTNSVSQIANFTAHAGHPWLSFAFDRTTLYGAERDGWSSYSVASPRDVTFQSNLTLRGRCDGADYRHGTTSVIAQQRAPYNIFGAGRSPCGNVIASKVDGSFDRIVQNITYQSSSRVHGMALDPENAYLYTADINANGIWTHKVDPVRGTLTNAKFKTHSEPNSRPRRLALHPKGRYLYVLLSKTNKIAVYDIQMQPTGPLLTYTGLNYNLVPQGTYIFCLSSFFSFMYDIIQRLSSRIARLTIPFRCELVKLPCS
jgi:carboxy-cis,cis-muconate cyclase